MKSRASLGMADRGFTARGCQALLTFVDASGQTLLNADGRPVQKRVSLQTGESAFLTVVANPGIAVGGWNNHNETLVEDTGT